MTSIEWTDETWNPVRGCSRVSPGCDNCYAMRMARRSDVPGGAYEGLTRIGKRGVDWAGSARLIPEQLDSPFTWRKARRVFVNSMSDLFHESLSEEQITHVFSTMAGTPQHTYQVLTKRAERMKNWVRMRKCSAGWPLPNVWLGVSVEDQQRAEERIPHLLDTPAAVRFISAEPLLGPLELRWWLSPWMPQRGTEIGRPPVGWVIVGGESGNGARLCDVDWIRAIVTACATGGTPCFVKQLGAVPREGRDCKELRLRNSKGGDPDEWPADLRVRQFPSISS